MMSAHLKIPASGATADVRVVDTKTLLLIDPALFVQPQTNARIRPFHAPIYCFLVSRGGRHVLFDLGVRPDWEEYAPRVVSLIKATTQVTTTGVDIAHVLDHDASGLRVGSRDIEAVIWSHNHFDHIGDPSVFPPSTDLVVGPGVKDASWPGWPRVPDASVLDSDAAGRTVREITFSGEGALRIGRFAAFDYFGDGSFYLLDAPGHAVGHMCGLARVQSSPAPAFVLMGADACHHPGVLRPSPHLPLPSPATIWGGPAPCPGELLHEFELGDTVRQQPFLTLPRNMLFPNHDAALDTVCKLQELDECEDVFIIIAHDVSIRDSLSFFPETINDWRERGIKKETRWKFCADFEVGKEPSEGLLK
ncbi:hypothetical protein SLS63_007859 [Diaporthe eres]|uniref:Metallo-beta-lactamase domain-containing protein n=1 Tax=Diaporthe eres TaxID=83184 RepID=A0ABR1P435_DIAER